MRIESIKLIHSADEARQMAIDWQNWQAEQDLSWAELGEWEHYFKRLARKFKLHDEFRENGII